MARAALCVERVWRIRWAQRAINVPKGSVALLRALQLEQVAREERSTENGVIGGAALLL